MIFLNNAAKNQIKIRSVAPKKELMSAQKKGIYLYKIHFCILAYYRGRVCLSRNPAHLGWSGRATGPFPHTPWAFLSLRCVLPWQILNQNFSTIKPKIRPTSADFFENFRKTPDSFYHHSNPYFGLSSLRLARF